MVSFVCFRQELKERNDRYHKKKRDECQKPTNHTEDWVWFVLKEEKTLGGLCKYVCIYKKKENSVYRYGCVWQ